MGPDLEAIVVTVVTFTAASFAICSVGFYMGVVLGRAVVRAIALLDKVLP